MATKSDLIAGALVALRHPIRAARIFKAVTKANREQGDLPPLTIRESPGRRRTSSPARAQTGASEAAK